MTAMLPKFAYKFWKVYDRFSMERSPGCLAPYQLRNIFLKYLIIISIIGIYIIFYNLQGRLYNRLNWPMKSM